MKTQEHKFLWIVTDEPGVYAVRLKSIKETKLKNGKGYTCVLAPPSDDRAMPAKLLIKLPAYYICPYHPDFRSTTPGYHDYGPNHCHAMLVPVYSDLV